MSYKLQRRFALIVLSGLLSILVTACSEGNKGGSGSGRATTNASPANNNASSSTAQNGAGGKAQGSAEPRQIEMDDDVFQPAQLTIPVGTTVKWVNKGKKAHTVVSTDKLFDSGLVNIGGQFSYTFDSPGTYSYRCSPHPKMLGQIVVK